MAEDWFSEIRVVVMLRNFGCFGTSTTQFLGKVRSSHIIVWCSILWLKGFVIKITLDCESLLGVWMNAWYNVFVCLQQPCVYMEIYFFSSDFQVKPCIFNLQLQDIFYMFIKCVHIKVGITIKLDCSSQ